MIDEGFLVLDSEGNQMVASVQLPKENQMKFDMVGAPPSNPRLDFKEE